jgi:cytochrome c-type biogenesis protein CcmH
MLHRIIILSFILITLMSSAATALTPGEVEESLTCYACPGEPLNIDRCSGGDQMRAATRKMVDEGKTKKEILDYFVGQFGEGILTIPPKKGFNLVAYIFPFIGLIFGVIIALVIAKRWSASGKIHDAPDKKTEEIMDEKMKKKIDSELKKLEEE